MAQSSTFIYSSDPAALNPLQETAKGLGHAVKSEPRDIEDAISDAPNWAIPPDILIVDMSGVEDIPGELERLAESGPSVQIAVIVVGDREDLRLARRLRGMGVVDYLLKPLVRDEVVEAMTSAMTQTDASKLSVDSSKLLTVTGAEGGTGVSIVAAALASRITHRQVKARVLLLDFDFVAGSQFILHGGEKTDSFANAIQEPARLDTVALERIVSRTKNPRLFFLSEPGKLKEPPDAAGLSLLLAQCTRAFDHVVVDLPRHADWARPALSLSSRIVYMTRPSLSGAVQLADFVETHDGQLIDDSLLILVNDTCGVGRQGIGIDQFRQRSQAPVISMPHDPILLDREVVEEEMSLKSGKFGKALRALDDRIPIAKQEPTPLTPPTKTGLLGRLGAWLKE